MRPPAPRPCVSCPYRLDVPSGVWAYEEYRKLATYDRETAEQDPGVFLCHQQDGKLCAGWVAVHDMDHSLGLRLAVSMGVISPEDAETILDYTTDVPLHGSGLAAALHGARSIPDPGPEARRMIARLERRLKEDA
jgi:Family of unknown function (DUF6283)